VRVRTKRLVLFLLGLAVVTALLGAALALGAATALILPTHTPGARYSKVTQATISSTICKKGWTATIRRPAGYTNALKLAEWHYADQNPSHYEEDHLISLELGGAPARSGTSGPSRTHSRSRAIRARTSGTRRSLGRP